MAALSCFSQPHIPGIQKCTNLTSIQKCTNVTSVGFGVIHRLVVGRHPRCLVVGRHPRCLMVGQEVLTVVVDS